MPPKRRPVATTPPATSATGVVRIGFSRDARAVFKKLSLKEKTGLRKLLDLGAAPAIGKPLVRELQGYHRVTYGRMRSIVQVIAKVVDRAVLVHYIGLRKAGSSSDPYEVAALAALKAGDPDAIAALELLVQQTLQGVQPDEEE